MGGSDPGLKREIKKRKFWCARRLLQKGKLHRKHGDKFKKGKSQYFG
jgi:hypothetical protein